MARALIVGCGCRGRLLAGLLESEGWAVRGTSRGEAGLAAIAAGGIEPALADPGRPGTLLDLVGDVAVVHWLMGSATGDGADLEAIHGSRLERILEKLVDTPVRGFVYEAAGTLPAALFERGATAARTASETWRIPVEIVEADPAEPGPWADAMRTATARLLSGGETPSR